MKIRKTRVQDCLVFVMQHYPDERGYFEELYSEKRHHKVVGLPRIWRQVNCSVSVAHVVRGLHIVPFPKLVTCLKGRIFDVVVDMREESHSYLKWYGTELSEDNKKQMYVPAHCAHGFMALEEENLVVYQQTRTYNPKRERAIHWQDPTLAVDWPHAERYIVSENDKNAPFLVLPDHQAERLLKRRAARQH